MRMRMRRVQESCPLLLLPLPLDACSSSESESPTSSVEKTDGIWVARLDVAAQMMLLRGMVKSTVSGAMSAVATCVV